MRLSSFAARAQHPGNEQAPQLTLQSPHSHSGDFYCTTLPNQCLPPNSLFHTREPESLLLRSWGFPCVNLPLKPLGLPNPNDQGGAAHFLGDSTGPGFLGVLSEFASTSIFRPCLTALTQCQLLNLLGPCLPLPGGELSATLLGS